MDWQTVLAVCTAALQGIEAGIAIAFWGFVMPGLARVSDSAGLQAMNSVNNAFVKGWMLPVFIMSGVLSGVVIYFSLYGAVPIKAGIASAIYLVGMVGVTLAFNVPLNIALLKHNDDTISSINAWRLYQPTWNRWNAIRSIAATLACVLSTYALVAG